MQRDRFEICVRVCSVIAFAALGGGVWHWGAGVIDYLFIIFAASGLLFSLLLSAVFIAGVFVILDRTLFFGLHLLLSRRLSPSQQAKNHPGNVFALFLNCAREFRATSEEGVYSDEIIDRAREVALRDSVDSEEIDRGRAWLEFLGTIAPAIGFLGTLVGLVESFRQLGASGKLNDVLSGLSLSLTTSVLGAIISLLFLSSAWLLGYARQRFDRHLYATIAAAQHTDVTGG